MNTSKNNTEIMHSAAYKFTIIGKYNRAANKYLEILKVSHTDIKALIRLSELQYCLQQYEKALNNALSARELAPFNTSAYSNYRLLKVKIKRKQDTTQ
jgi:tetratricopeptide (TPR) repeat protein